MSIDLATTAERAVERLRARGETGPLPEDDRAWNGVYIQEIRAFKDRFRDSPDLQPLLEIASDQLYGRDIHWALELIQNAEDSESRHITFVFEEDRVTVANDGLAFTAADVWGVCSAGHSPKKSKIGFFGIGFKSVIRITDAPEVHSGSYAFRILDKIYPEPLPVGRLRSRGARFVLPVRAKDRDSLGRIVRDLTNPEFLQLLLTLRHLESIRVVDRLGDRGRGRFYRRPLAGDGPATFDECEIGSTWPGGTSEAWRRYTFATPESPPGIVRQGRKEANASTTNIVLARPVSGRPVASKIHCFLPLDVNSELRWLVQADFDPTPGRERLRENGWNRWLLGQAGVAIAAAVEAEARAGVPPWGFIPVASDISPGSMQRLAQEAAHQALRTARFVRTGQGWRTPERTAVPADREFRDTVRERDLELVTPAKASYVAGDMVPDDQPGGARLRTVLGALGSTMIGINHLIQIMALDDDRFRRRDNHWWLLALDQFARLADAQQKSTLAKTRCIPVGEGKRVAPSPPVALDGYLVAYSRSATIQDLRRYFRESEIHLVDPYFDPVAGVLRERRRGGEADDRTRVREMLTRAPFGVALEAGPYHVVQDLVLPRMAALATVDELDGEQRDQLARMVEFVRHRWKGYVSDAKRSRRVTDDRILARELGRNVYVVATRLSPSTHDVAGRLTETYLGSEFLGYEGMDVAFAGSSQLQVAHPIHLRTMPVPRQRGVARGVRAQLPPTEFLRLLGAPVGPILSPRGGEATSAGLIADIERHRVPWIRWPKGTGHRPAGLLNDATCPDLDWLATAWPRMGPAEQLMRGKALWRGLEEDWDRLGSQTRTQAAYSRYGWQVDPVEWPATWLSQLQSMAWIGSRSETLVRPSSLVLSTDVNRMALGGDRSALLGWTSSVAAMAKVMGVADRPPTSVAIASLGRLRDGATDEALTRRAASACYDVIAGNLAVMTDLAASSEIERIVRPKFQGNSRTGLIFAPPPAGIGGKEWWPPSRTIRANASRVVGPYLGQLAGRYPRATVLWDALGIQAALSPALVTDAIRLEMASNDVDDTARHYYGEMIAHLEASVPAIAGAGARIPALTDDGWREPTDTFWTTRPEVRAAFQESVSFWQPGVFDPSIVQGAARYLGIRDLDDGMLTERWEIGSRLQLDNELEALWLSAMHAWPSVLRAEGGWSEGEAQDLRRVVLTVRPALVASITGWLIINGEPPISAPAIQPAAVLLEEGLLALDANTLFSGAAAHALAGLAPRRRLAATNTLSAMLAEAYRTRQAASHPDEATIDFDEAAFQINEDDFADPAELDAAIQAIGVAPAPASQGPEQPPSAPPRRKVFADPESFALERIEVESRPPNDPAFAERPKGLKTKLPTPEYERPDKPPGDQPPIPSNVATEDAARPFVEQFERARGAGPIHRQGGLVGADFVATDGRYIEVKATGGTASDSFDLEASEWHVALDPSTRDRFWVYIVEHLNDGEAPIVTAIRNPVRDANLGHHPVGKMRVTGWRSGQHLEVGRAVNNAPAISGDGDQPGGPS